MAHEHRISSETSRVYALCIALNVSYVIVEGLTGLAIGSVGLLSDAGHNLSDVLTLALSLFAFRLSRTHARGKYTFGLRKISVAISMFNSLLLFAAVALIAAGAVSKFIHPAPLDGTAISVTAGIGIAVNGLTSWLLLRQNQKDVNNRAAYLHMLADTLVSAGVVVSGIVVDLTGWVVVDPVISLAIGAIILTGSVRLLRESFRLIADAVPESYDLDEARKAIESCDGVLLAEHIHIWPISTSEAALTAHVVIKDIRDSEKILAGIKHALGGIGISHSTIETGTKPEGTPMSGI